MKPEEIEKLSLDELQRIAEDPQIVVPDGLADRLQDITGRGADHDDCGDHSPEKTH